MKASVFRKATFNAAHRLLNPDWSDAKNSDVFGKCFNPNYHGHNYELTLRVTGDINPETGYVMDLKLLNDLVQDEIVERFDHKNLNLDTLEFRELNPTAEHIAMVIYNILRPKIDLKYEIQVTLSETPRNYVMFPS